MLRVTRKPTAAKRGFNLIEAAIVLGVVGLVIGGIWVAAAAVQANLRKADAAKGLIQIVQNTRNLYYGQSPSATENITAQLVSAKALPGDFINGTNGINPFNGAVTVSIADTVNFDDIAVVYANVPKDACIDLTSKNTNISTGLGLSAIAIDATGGGTDATITTFPYLPTAAATNCGDTNSITWTFGLRG
jgi:type II secretory pathway pseudopilin PulG